jgi:hypothetical protein
MQAFAKTRRTPASAQENSQERVEDMEKSTRASTGSTERELPGTSAMNAIPPTDSPRYRQLQAEFGLRSDEPLGGLR